MSVIAEFTVPADTLALSETLEVTPEMIIDIERVVAHDENRVMPYFWVRGGDYTTFETAVTDDPTVQNVTKLDEYEDGTLYRAEWTQNIESHLRLSRNRGHNRGSDWARGQLGTQDAVRRRTTRH